MSPIRVIVALFSALAFLVVSPISARAGTYTVRSCWSNALYDGWETISYTQLPLYGAIDDCKTYNGQLIAESFPYQGHTWAQNDAYGHVFTAPGRTRITGFSADVSGQSGSGRVPIAEPWFRGLWEPRTDRSWAFENPVDQESHFSVDGLSASKLAVGLLCTAATCTFPGWDVPLLPTLPLPGPIWQGDYDQLAQARNITLTIEDDEPPALQILQGVPDGWQNDSLLPVAFNASDNVGAYNLRVVIDGAQKGISNRTCFEGQLNSARQPCADPGPPLQKNLEIGGLSDGPHEVRFQALDVADNLTEKAVTLWTDHTAPGAPRALQLDGPDGWRADNRFAVEWAAPPDDGSAPIDAAAYQLCPASNQPYDETGCVRGERSGSRVSHIDDLALPSSGEWRLRVALRDAAGNLDWDRAAVLERLRLDTGAPLVAFQPFDPADPARVRLAASDGESGIATVEIEVRRHGETLWRTLQVTGTGNQYAAMLDDGELRDGTYDVRARVTDQAGNERTTENLAGGTPLSVRLPIRDAITLAVGHPERVRVKSAKAKDPHYRRVLVAKPQAVYGESVAIEGRLTDAAGNPRLDAAIQVLERVDLPGRDWQQLATVGVTPSGTFTFKALPGPARVLRFVYPGTATSRPRSEDVELRIGAGVNLTPSRRRVVNGEAVEFRGRLLGGPLPATGKLLALQALTNRGWRTFATPRARASDGRFSVRYRFTGTPVTTRYAFRVMVPEESGYPYARGTSKVTKVLVRGSG